MTTRSNDVRHVDTPTKFCPPPTLSMSTASEDAKIVQAFSRDVTRFKGLVSKVGTSQDSVQLRREIHSLAETARTKAHDAKRRCEPNAKSKDSATKVQYSRLITQLMSDVKSLTSSENELKSKEREHPTPPQGSRGGGGGGGFSSATWGDDEPRQNQAQTVHQTQAFDVQVYDETKERAEQLNQLESNMKDLNEMFLEMGTLVADQGEALDLIETNVERAGMSVEHAKEETSKALTLKEKIRKKKWCCLLCTLILLGLIGAIIAIIVTQTT